MNLDIDKESLDNEQEFRLQQGKLLKRARKTSKQSQEQVGAVFGLSQDTISKIENGQQSVSTYRLREFAKLYNKPISFFYMTNQSSMYSSRD